MKKKTMQMLISCTIYCKFHVHTVETKSKESLWLSTNHIMKYFFSLLFRSVMFVFKFCIQCTTSWKICNSVLLSSITSHICMLYFSVAATGYSSCNNHFQLYIINYVLCSLLWNVILEFVFVIQKSNTIKFGHTEC